MHKPVSPHTFNTGETTESLRREYNPDGSVLRCAQLRLLDMAIYLQQTAKQIGIPCRIDGGNVLGALRHGGFIPWDDDMDFVVEYKDFHRLCNYLKQHPHPQYVLQDHDTDPHYYKEWAMLRDLGTTTQSHDEPDSGERRMHDAQRFKGLHVDIFPYEADMIPWLQRLAGKLSVNVNLKLAGRYPLLAEAAYRLLHYVIFPTFRLIGRLFGDHDLYIHSYGAWFYEQNPRRAMVPHKDIMFEGHLFEGPADPDEICRIAYGDYMQLPPRDKRDRHKIDIVFSDQGQSVALQSLTEMKERKSEMKKIALILAGGRGTRMHSSTVPKQFLEIDGRPIVIHTLEVFSNQPRVDAIIVACLEGWIPFLQENILRFGISKVAAIVPGGNTGQDSIYHALCAAKEYVGHEDAIVLVHDAVRPLITSQTINDNIDMARKYGNCVTCGPVLETLVVRQNDGTMNFPNRSDAMVARAPQCFLLGELSCAHERALADGRHDFPDSCTLMGYYGSEIKTLMDSGENIKITTPTDLQVAKYILRARGKKRTDGV